MFYCKDHDLAENAGLTLSLRMSMVTLWGKLILAVSIRDFVLTLTTQSS